MTVRQDTRLAEIMGAGEHDEAFFCNYQADPAYIPRYVASGVCISAIGPQGELRGIELTEHPFFIATLFQPQLTSKATGKPHPLIVGYLRSTQRSRALSDPSIRD